MWRLFCSLFLHICISSQKKKKKRKELGGEYSEFACVLMFTVNVEFQVLNSTDVLLPRIAKMTNLAPGLTYGLSSWNHDSVRLFSICKVETLTFCFCDCRCLYRKGAEARWACCPNYTGISTYKSIWSSNMASRPWPITHGKAHHAASLGINPHHSSEQFSEDCIWLQRAVFFFLIITQCCTKCRQVFLDEEHGPVSHWGGPESGTRVLKSSHFF